MPRKLVAPAKPAQKSARAETKSVTSAAHAISGMFSGLGLAPVRTTLAPVRRVETDLIQFDWLTGINGCPQGRTMMVHGPSNMGKSLWCLALMRSFVKRGHAGLYIDAEFTLDEGYAEFVMGSDVVDSGLFQSMKPDSYEHVVETVRAFAKQLTQLRKDGTISPDTGAIIVVDSVKKLVPQKLFDRLAGEKDNSIDGYGGRGAQFKAALNSQWSDELVPLCHKNLITVVFVARETDNESTDWGADEFKVGGGKALYYDASLVVRIDRAGYVGTKPAADSKTPGVLYGERHRMTVYKTKLSSKTDRKPVAYFHSSNGVATPKGLDPARDLLDLGVRFGVVSKSGSWIQFEDFKRQGEHSFVASLYEEPAVMAALHAAVRAKLTTVEAPEGEE